MSSRSTRKAGAPAHPKTTWQEWAFPFAVLIGLYVLGAGSHLLLPGRFDTGPWGYLTPWAWLVGFGLLAWHTTLYTAPRGKVIHRHVTATLIGAGLMTALLSITGMSIWFWTSPVFWIIGFPGAFCALSWNMPRTRAIKGEGKDTHRDGVDLDKLGLNAQTVLRNSKTIVGEIIVDHADGEDTKVLQSALVKLESKAKLLAGTLTAQIGKHRGQSVLKAMDPGLLDLPVIHPGPSRSGGSITEPLRTGRYIDGVDHEFVTVNHGMTVGMTDAGKTYEAYYKVTEMLTRIDVVVFWNDPIKGMQSAGPVLAGVDWAAQDEREAKLMLKAIMAAIGARTNELGRLGYTKWTAEVYRKHKIPKLFVQFEEGAWLIESGTLVKIAERARSAGIEFEISQQRASHDRMDTSVRAMLGRRTCFGVDSTTDAEFCLSAETMDAGAVPHTWRDSKKGAFYREASTIPPERWPVAIRSFVLPAKPDDPAEFDASFLTRIIAEHAHLRAVLDPVTVAAMNPFGYAGRAQAKTQPVPVQQQRAQAPAKVLVMAGGGPGPDDFDPFDPDDEDDVLTDDDLDEDLGLPMPDLSDLAGVDPFEDVPDATDDIDLSNTDPILPTEQRNELFRELIQEYLDRGQSAIAQAELAARWAEIPGAGGRPWPYMRLGAYEREGLAHRDEDDPRLWVLTPAAGARTVTVSEDEG